MGEGLENRVNEANFNLNYFPTLKKIYIYIEGKLHPGRGITSQVISGMYFPVDISPGLAK